jgi:hypothetical protein
MWTCLGIILLAFAGCIIIKLNQSYSEYTPEYYKIFVDGYGKYTVKRYLANFENYGFEIGGSFDSLEAAEKEIKKRKEYATKSVKKLVRTVE